MKKQRLYLGSSKVFHMFFNSYHRYHFDTDMLRNIQKVLVVPPQIPKLKPLRPLPEQPGPKPWAFETKSLSSQYGLGRAPRLGIACLPKLVQGRDGRRCTSHLALGFLSLSYSSGISSCTIIIKQSHRFPHRKLFSLLEKSDINFKNETTV
ncbi:uncharacterized protein LOC120287560 [Eucalyptus grandis]|uniref:uncharacterized protein LOC120287560 n=1 Tax=Eucalyptus grandis TaxID=71139 RepID=UPI00192ED5D7|nr:uncharacterized protein LOC120287560 [Eucalyptus grandis]